MRPFGLFACVVIVAAYFSASARADDTKGEDSYQCQFEVSQ